MKPRKASQQVTLVLSGALTLVTVAGCSRSVQPPLMNVQLEKDTNQYTNNTQVAGRGYYHSHSGIWYPFPWGHYDSRYGYFYDGQWSAQPRMGPPPMIASTPKGLASLAPQSRSSSSYGGSTHSSSHSSGSISRGGFGSSGHSASS
ncbi:MAG: hypothetical protein WCO56_00735 [Verrucomicrobiota bacterium]